MKNTRIGIVGHGFVGKALSDGLKHFGYEQVFVHDVAYKTKIEDVANTEVCFICVPTPMDADGSMSDDIIVDVLSKLEVLDYQGVVAIKSTVTPPVVHKLIKDFSTLRIVTNPEFLTERRALEDFINTEWVYIGSNNGDGQIIYDLHADMFPDAVIKVVSPEAAVMVKYMSNTWFSVKVSLMNEFYDLWNELGYGDWDQIPDAFQHDTRVGKTHLQVPGPDGSRGFGGKCFPKDLNALMAVARQLGTQHDVMKAAWADNKVFRKEKDWLDIAGAVTESYKESSN
jgi:UDPglucose 6-dehydrogenase